MKRINDIPFNQNGYLVNVKKGLIIIDPGFNWKVIEKEIGQEKPIAILLTHYHFDHVAGVNALCQKYGIKAYIHEKDYQGLISDTLAITFGYDDIKINPKNIKTFTNEIEEFKDVIIEHVPGHCPGLVTFKINNYLFTGDLLYKDSIGRTDLPGSNPPEMKKSLMKIKNYPDELIICPGHGVTGTLKEFKEVNPFLEYLYKDK